MYSLETFKHEKFNQLRIIKQDSKPWFIAIDVARALGYSTPAKTIQKHCKYSKLLKNVKMAFLNVPPRGYLIIPESDVYRLVMRSKMPNAELFQDWVIEEVLPAIRKTGCYFMMPNSSDGAKQQSDLNIRAYATTLRQMAKLSIYPKEMKAIFLAKAASALSGDNVSKFLPPVEYKNTWF